MPTVVVPVGLHLGPSHRYATPPDPHPEFWEVRLSSDSEELTEEEFQVWGRAFLDPERHARLEINRDSLQLELLLAGKGPADPTAVVDRLLERGLLIEFDPDADLETAFRRVSLHPLAEGMGNTPEEPDRRLIGHNGQALVKVTGTVYGIWAFSSAEGSIWDFCVGMDEDNQRDLRAGMDLERLTAGEAARETATVIPMLIASGVAFLDRVA